MEEEGSPFIYASVSNTNIPKKHLQNSSILINKTSSKKSLNILRYTWCIGSYCELQTGVAYERFEEKAYHSCSFQLQKTENDLILCVVVEGNLIEYGCLQVYIKISSETPSDSEDFVTNKSFSSEIRRAVEETKGKFILKFPSQVLASRNAHQKVPLYVLYHLVSRSREQPLMFWTGSIGKKSASEVSGHISFEKNSSQFSDFTIIARKRLFRAHKCILVVRSRYFMEYFKCQGQVTHMEVDALPGIVWYVICFMYAGQIDVLDINTMIQILHLAEKWKILGLMEICSDYLKGNMSLRDMNKATELGLDVTCFGVSEVTKQLEKLQLGEETK